MKIVAVTSCPTGIAHTYMAAEALERAAKTRGHEIVVETQGAAGMDPVPPEFLAACDVVILAADAVVRDRNRFEHLPLVESSVAQAIHKAATLIERAEAAAEGRPYEPDGETRESPFKGMFRRRK